MPGAARLRDDSPLVVVIGANGAGKSTWCGAHRDELPANFYDADSIAQGLGSYNDRALQLEARAIVDDRIEQHLRRGETFCFESTYSGKSRPRIVERAAEQGCTIYAVFIGTDDPQINIERVQARVASGTGHHVPNPKSAGDGPPLNKTYSAPSTSSTVF